MMRINGHQFFIIDGSSPHLFSPAMAPRGAWDLPGRSPGGPSWWPGAAHWPRLHLWPRLAVQRQGALSDDPWRLPKGEQMWTDVKDDEMMVNGWLKDG